MRILIYGINFAPELTGIGKYSGEMADMLAKMGHEVRVITAPPYYPHWQVDAAYSQWRYSSEEMNGVRVMRCPLWVPRNPCGVRRLVHLASFALTSSFRLFTQIPWRPQIVLVIAPTLFCAPAAWVVARLTGARAWLHIQDFELDAAVGLGLLRNAWILALAQRFERFWLRWFDRVSTISDAMQARLVAKGVANERCVMFPNWVDTNMIYPLPEPTRYRTELRLTADTMVALYAGAMGEKQGLEMIIEAARQLESQPQIVFVLAGAGTARARLEQLSQGMRNIRWLPVQPAARLNDLLNLADIHLLPQQAGAEDLVMPSKLTGMLASGRPVVATATPGSQLASVVSTMGAVTPPGDIDRFAAAIYNFAIDLPARKEHGERARQYAQSHLDYATIIRQFEQQLVQRRC